MVVKSKQASPKRWAILILLAALYFFTDWVAFSVSPNSTVFEKQFSGLDSSKLVVVFLCASLVVGIFCSSLFRLMGTRNAILLAAFLLFVGNLVKSGVPFLLEYESTACLYIGFAIAGGAQPLVQTSMLETITLWFPAEERDMAIGVSATAGDIGIALSYLIGSYIADDKFDIRLYLDVLTIIGMVLFVFSLIFFSERPPAGKTRNGTRCISQVEELKESTFAEDWKIACDYLQAPGFPLYIFLAAYATTITDIVGTYLEEIYNKLDFSDDFSVSLVGGAYFIMVLVAACQIGRLQQCIRGRDGSNNLFSFLLTLCGCSGVLLYAMIPCLLGDSVIICSLVLVALACFIGPLKSMGVTLSADAVHPTNEIRLAMVEMLFINGCSASVVFMFGELQDLNLTVPYVVNFCILGSFGLFCAFCVTSQHKVLKNHDRVHLIADEEKEPLIEDEI